MFIFRRILALSLMLFFTVTGFSQLTVIDSIKVKSDPEGIAINTETNRIYVTNAGSDTVSIIDGDLDSVIRNKAVGAIPMSVCVNPETNRAYVVNYNSANVSVIEGTGVIATIDVDILGPFKQGIGVNPQSNLIYVSCYNPPDINVINGYTNSVIRSYEIGDFPSAIAVNPQTNHIYVASFDNKGKVSIIDEKMNSVVAKVWVGSYLVGIAVNPETNRIYVTGGSAVYVIDGETERVIKTINVKGSGIAVNPETNRIYVANSSDNILSVINGANNSLIDSIVVGKRPTAVAINPQTNKIYVTCASDNSVWVLQDESAGMEESLHNPQGLNLSITPNPFTTETTIRYELPRETVLSVSVYNMLGQKVRALYSGKQSSGVHSVSWDGTGDAGEKSSSGIYLLKIKAGEKEASTKVMFVR